MPFPRQRIFAALLLAGATAAMPGETVTPVPEADEVSRPSVGTGADLRPERTIPARARELHQQARQLGQKGQYQDALTKLDEAAALAPEWPYPIYDTAYTYLLMGQYEQALTQYRKVDALMPEGFITTKTAIWTLEREARGLFPEGLYLGYVSLEWTPEQERRLKIATLVQKFPNFAPAWKDAANFVDDPAKRILVINQGLAAAPDPETYGILMINKALAYDEGGETQRAIDILEALIDKPGATFATQGIAEKTLARLRAKTNPE